MEFENILKNEIIEMNNEIINSFIRKWNYKKAIYPYCNQGLHLKDELLKYKININFFCNNGGILPEYNRNNDVIYNIWDYKNSKLLDKTVVFNADINESLQNFWDMEYIGFPIENIITPEQLNYMLKIYNFDTNQFNDVDLINKNELINLSKCNDVYNLLDDEISKKIYLYILAKRLIDCPFYIDVFSRNETEYFDSNLIKLKESEVFVDCGGFTGDTIQSFNTAANGKYQKIYTFEPETDEFCKMVNNTNKMKNIIYFNAGVSDKNEELKFKQLNHGSSYFVNDLEKKETDYSIKKALKGDDIKINATFIKMDIEGSELKALKGFKNTIKKYKPNLAICIYHRVEHLWEIPLYIKELCPEYKIYIRHYSSIQIETVCYATIE